MSDQTLKTLDTTDRVHAMQSDATEYRITWDQPGVGKLTSASTYRNRKTAEEIAAIWTKHIGIEHKVEQVTKEQSK